MKATAAQVEPADPHWSIEAKKHEGNSHSTFSACRVQSAIFPTITSAQRILLEGKIRPANWTYHKDYKRCDLLSFGAFFLGRQVSNSDTKIPSWAERELLDSAEKKGKGQQEIIISAMYHGALEHTAYKAGGNEKAQLGVSDKGIVTTSEKYTIANSYHVGLKFIAVKWENLAPRIDLAGSESEDLTFRGTEARHSRRRQT